MANRMFSEMQCLGGDLVLIAGRFATNDTSDPSSASNVGRGWSVVRSGAGLYTITFSDKFANLVSFVPSLQISADAGQGTDFVIKPVTFTSTTPSMTVQCFDLSGGAAADVDAGSNNFVHFIAVMKLLSVPA